MTTTSPDLEVLRASALLDQNPTAAMAVASALLAQFPLHDGARHLFVAASRRVSNPESATPILETLAGSCPDAPILHFEVGRNYATVGRADEALAAFARTVELDPTFADAWRELALQWFSRGDVSNGDSAYARYERLVPDPPELTDANVALAADNLDAAEMALRQRLKVAPQDPVGLRLSAEVAVRRGDHESAEAYLQKSLKQAPGYAAARLALARLQYLQQRIEEVLPNVDRLLAVDPDNTTYLALTALSIRFVNRHEEALVLLEKAVAIRPTDAPLWLAYGNLLRECGHQDRAIKAYRRALIERSGFGEAYWCLANLKTLRMTENDRADMLRQLALSPAANSDRIHLEFALGKVCEDLGSYA